jgi:hypothetical protein
VTIDSTLFSYTGAVVDYIVPVTAVYYIVAAGAQGGGGNGEDGEEGGGGDDSGGYGAVVSGDILLTAGTELEIAVGGVGSTGDFDGNFGGGGGGGSFVAEAGPSVVPEPTSVLWLSVGLVGLVLGRRRNRKKAVSL